MIIQCLLSRLMHLSELLDPREGRMKMGLAGNHSFFAIFVRAYTWCCTGISVCCPMLTYSFRGNCGQADGRGHHNKKGNPCSFLLPKSFLPSCRCIKVVDTSNIFTKHSNLKRPLIHLLQLFWGMGWVFHAFAICNEGVARQPHTCLQLTFLSLP